MVEHLSLITIGAIPMTSLADVLAVLLCLTISESEQGPMAQPMVKKLILEDVDNNGQNCSAPARDAGTRAADKVRVLLTEIDECDDEFRRLRLENRLEASAHDHWEIARPLQFAESAQRMKVERDLLEALLLAVALDGAKQVRVPYSPIRRNTLAALAWPILEKNMPEVEEHLRAWRWEPMYGPDKEGSLAYVLRATSKALTRSSPLEAPFAAIDSYKDGRAREYLLDLALKESEPGESEDVRMRAWMLLLHYDPRAIPHFERALEAAIGASSAGQEINEDARTRASSSASRSYLAQLEYVESLAPDVRQRYHRINTLLACCAALAFPRGPEGGKPDLVVSNWQDGDERFLPHMFTTGVIGDHQGDLLLTSAPISSQGLSWLKEQADSEDLPRWAKQILSNRLRASESRQ
jgi:hypothetical protein